MKNALFVAVLVALLGFASFASAACPCQQNGVCALPAHPVAHATATVVEKAAKVVTAPVRWVFRHRCHCAACACSAACVVPKACTPVAPKCAPLPPTCAPAAPTPPAYGPAAPACDPPVRIKAVRVRCSNCG